jgi:hypothetical protein
MRTNFLKAFGLGLAMFLGACDGGGGGTCGNTAACGGDVVGTWKISSTCLTIDPNATMGMTECPGETVSVVDLKETGTVTYKADNTYSAMTSVSGTIVIGLPKSCLSQGGLTLTCAQLNQVLAQSTAGDPTAPKVTCVEAGASCSCTMTLPPTPSSESGTYTTTAAGLLTQQPTNGDSSAVDYCVKGQTLTISPHADSSMMGMSGISGTITATKQ